MIFKNNILFLCLLFPVFCVADTDKPVSQIQLISPYQTLSPDTKKVPIGLWISLKEGWHSYWHYPGETGKALKIHWTLPQGTLMSPLRWPLPERIRFGSLTAFGYKNSFLLMGELYPRGTTLVPLQKKKPLRGTHANPQKNLSALDMAPQPIQIEAQVEWFVCKEVCIPLRQTLNISWHIRAEAQIHDRTQALFKEWAFKQAQQAQQDLVFHKKDKKYWQADWTTKKMLKLVDVIPFAPYPLSPHQPLILSKASYQHTVYIKPQSGLAKPVIQRWQEKYNNKKNQILTIYKDKDNKKQGFVYTFYTPKSSFLSQQSLLWFLLISFLGGLLLNLMPCVLPIVFLKFSNTVQQTGQKKSIIILENLFYSVGVIASFLFLAGLIFLLKQGGESIGWGFHLQSPYVLLILIFLFTFISLAFMGWFSVPALPFFHLEKQGYCRHFLTGVLSTASASPCTAPFMGAGVGYGLSGSGLDLILVFLFLGLGLSFPYLLLSVFPSWMRYVPLPGQWTQKLKQFMAFPMMGTALWLISVLNQQRTESLFVVLFCLLLLALAFWILKQQLGSKFRFLAWGILLVAGLGPFLHIYQAEPALKMKWEEFSFRKMDKARAEGRAFFVNITADWCITCKFNERITFQNKKVVQFFKDKNILALRGDWTQPDKEIAELLELYDRAGIPFYLYTPSKAGDLRVLPSGQAESAPRVLPELLTPAVFFKHTATTQSAKGILP